MDRVTPRPGGDAKCEGSPWECVSLGCGSDPPDWALANGSEPRAKPAKAAPLRNPLRPDRSESMITSRYFQISGGNSGLRESTERPFSAPPHDSADKVPVCG